MHRETPWHDSEDAYCLLKQSSTESCSPPLPAGRDNNKKYYVKQLAVRVHNFRPVLDEHAVTILVIRFWFSSGLIVYSVGRDFKLVRIWHKNGPTIETNVFFRNICNH